MPIESLFVPNECLQGQDVPSHIIWQNIRYNAIKITIPPIMKIKEIYNTSEAFWTKEGDAIRVSQVEVDGYLGMLFTTSKFEKNSYDALIKFSFIDENNLEIEKVTKSVHLFRPDIVVKEIPSEIKIDFSKKSVESKIRTQNIGEGTAIISVETAANSDVQKKLPKNVREFRSKFRKDLTEQMKKVQTDFPQHLQVLDEFLDIIDEAYKLDEKEISIETRTILERAQSWYQKISEVFEVNEDFLYAFAEAFAVTFLKNIQIITILENFLSYLESIAKRKVLLTDPLEVLEIGPAPKKMLLRIVPTDLLLGKYEPIILQPIQIRADKEGEIPVHELIEWV